MNKEFWKLVCFALPFWKFGMTIVIALLLLSLFSFPLIQEGSPTYYIFMGNVTILVPLLALTIYVLYRCSDS